MTLKSFCELTCLSSVVFTIFNLQLLVIHSFLDPFTGSERRFGVRFVENHCCQHEIMLAKLPWAGSLSNQCNTGTCHAILCFEN